MNEYDGRTLWMVRHGESTWNVLGLIQGQADGPALTDKGRRQSAQVAQQFRRVRIGAIYTSDLWRAQETAAFVGKALGLSVATDPTLRERCFGSYEGLPLSALDTVDSGICGDQVIDATARPTGGSRSTTSTSGWAPFSSGSTQSIEEAMSSS